MIFSRVYVSIRTKIAIVISALLFIALFLYAYVAVKMIIDDKGAYIFESSLTTVEVLDNQVKGFLNDAVKTIGLISDANVTRNKELGLALMRANPSLVELVEYPVKGKTDEVIRIRDEKKLGAYANATRGLAKLQKEVEATLGGVQKDKIKTIPFVEEKIPFLAVIGVTSRGTRFAAFFLSEKLLEFIQKVNPYNAYVINSKGDMIAHKEAATFAHVSPLKEIPYLRSIMSRAERKGVQELKGGGKNAYIVAFSKIDALDAIVVTEIKRSDAFLVATQLMRKSILFAVFIVGIAILIALTLAGSLTKPIANLFYATQKISQGDFKTTVEISSKDEIGVLANSFNMMTRKIAYLLEEEKEKIKMEKELEVAELVQRSFFPENLATVGNVELAAFYQPSAKCGGDWWNYFHHNGKLVVFLGDATGHGVPAALITATAASSFSILKRFALDGSDLFESPARLLDFLNKAVVEAAQGRVLMSFFIAIIDLNSSEVKYSNAAHNYPIMVKTKGGTEASRKNLHPLSSAVGSHLGQSIDSEYTDAIVSLNPGDSLLMYTDGLIECKNPENEEWGRRNFIATLLKHVTLNAKEMCDAVVLEAGEFYQGTPPADDITLVVAKIG